MFIFIISIFALYCGLKSDVYVDDVFITLKYARNISEGKGMVFNSGERILGVTSPLWCWLNAAVFVILPYNGFGVLGCRILSVISIFGAALGFYRLGREMGWGMAGLIGAIGVCLLSENISILGIEYPLCIWLALEIIIAFLKGRWRVEGFLGGLMVLVRPEAAIFVFLVFVLEIIQKSKEKERLKMALYFLIPIVPALLFLTLYFGSPIPNTLSAKRAQLTDPGFFWANSVGLSTWRYFIVEFLRKGTLDVFLFLIGLAWLFIRIAMRGDFIKTRRCFAVVLVFFWVVLHVIALHAIKVAFYRWYLYPVWLGIFICITAGMGAILGFVENQGAAGKGAGRAIVAGIFLIVIVTWQSGWTQNINPGQKARYDGYKKIAERLNGDTGGKEVQLICHEIGVLGFYAGENVEIIDEYFLIKKIPERADGRFPNRIELAFEFRPEYLVESHPFYEGMPEGVRAFQNKRLEDDYKETFTGKNSERITYIPLLKIKSEFGIQVLYRLEGK